MALKRTPGTNLKGASFGTDTVSRVWLKGRVVPGRPPDAIRADACGALIRRDDYGDTSSDYGWEIDHIEPVAQGGTDELENLQPLHWRNNRHKADSWPSWDCAVTAK